MNSERPRQPATAEPAGSLSDAEALAYYEFWLQGVHATDEEIDPELLIRGGNLYVSLRQQMLAALSPRDAAALAVEAALDAEDDEIE